MKAYGLSVELNPLIVKLSDTLGIEFGTLIGIMGPASALILLCLWTHFQVGLAFMLGMRAKMFFNQVQSIMFERQLKEFKRSLDIHGVRALPPARLSDACGAKPTVAVVDDLDPVKSSSKDRK